MAIPRRLLVDPENALHYHLTSRCVRRAFLCGKDPVSGQDYSHRRQRLEERLLGLVPAFPIELHGYAIMENHFHLVVHYDPKASKSWSPEEVAHRWLTAHPPRHNVSREAALQELISRFKSDVARLAYCQERLSSLSVFMQLLKQPIARRANLEDGVTGHFFEQRFYSGALLSLNALVAATAYVDLNPVRARITRDILKSKNTSLAFRLQHHSRAALDEYLQPIASGLEKSSPKFDFSLRTYIRQLVSVARASRRSARRRKSSPWARAIATFGAKQRAYGTEEELREWLGLRGLTCREIALE